MREFKIGDVVTLNGGSPKMTVTSISNNRVNVIYFHKSKLKELVFDKDTLKIEEQVKDKIEEQVQKPLTEELTPLEKKIFYGVPISEIISGDAAINEKPSGDSLTEEETKRFFQRYDSLGFGNRPNKITMTIGKTYRNKITGSNDQIVDADAVYVYFDQDNGTSLRIKKDEFSKYYENIVQEKPKENKFSSEFIEWINKFASDLKEGKIPTSIDTQYLNILENIGTGKLVSDEMDIESFKEAEKNRINYLINNISTFVIDRPSVPNHNSIFKGKIETATYPNSGVLNYEGSNIPTDLKKIHEKAKRFSITKPEQSQVFKINFGGNTEKMRKGLYNLVEMASTEGLKNSIKGSNIGRVYVQIVGKHSHTCTDSMVNLSPLQSLGLEELPKNRMGIMEFVGFSKIDDHPLFKSFRDTTDVSMLPNFKPDQNLNTFSFLDTVIDVLNPENGISFAKNLTKNMIVKFSVTDFQLVAGYNKFIKEAMFY